MKMEDNNEITEQEVKEIQRLIQMGSTTRVIAEAFGRSVRTIENIRFERWEKEIKV